MADAIRVFQTVTNPTGSTSNLVGADHNLGPSLVRRILLTFPAGCGGLVGVQIRAGAGFAFPSLATDFLSFDDYTYAFDVDNQIDSGQWSKVAYNVDTIPHLVQVVYEFDYLRGTVSQSSSQPVSI